MRTPNCRPRGNGTKKNPGRRRITGSRAGMPEQVDCRPRAQGANDHRNSDKPEIVLVDETGNDTHELQELPDVRAAASDQNRLQAVNLWQGPIGLSVGQPARMPDTMLRAIDIMCESGAVYVRSIMDLW